jgi:prepilin-type N-terminal cleavage/methylation domain-containing protein
MPNRSQGFTLIEVLVVILLLGMIVVALTGGVHFAGRAWQTQEGELNRQGDIGAVQTAVREILVSARNFEADGESLKCVGQLPKGLNRGGDYDLEFHDVDGRLVLSWKPHFTGPAPENPATDTELLKGIGALKFDYFLDGTWQAESKDKGKPPLLIRMSVAMTSGQPWPPLTIAPMIDAPPGAQN